ncbi:V-type ATP synthase subunit D [Candidatus Micrarchaeota archaeon]|nr:V-type ATP synthase subunit D [Candidatus Micrarchaeota archaeon]
MAEKANPTRMELLKTKSRIKLAKNGHNLLKQKRDALIMEFFKILKKAKDLRGELNEKMGEAYKSLSIAHAYHTTFELESIASGLEQDLGLEVKSRNVMGVRIPEIKEEIEEKKFGERGYSVMGTSAKVDDVVEDFGSVLRIVVTLAETETAIKRLIKEIEKTKRRVNALEFVVIPRLEKQRDDIIFRLEEMERDSFVSLKVIKKRLEEEAAGKEAA